MLKLIVLDQSGSAGRRPMLPPMLSDLARSDCQHRPRCAGYRAAQERSAAQPSYHSTADDNGIGLRSIATSATAGASYCAIVFAAGFLMGVVRYRVATRIGEVPAVILKLPVMLALCWWACGRVVTWCLPRCPSASRSGAAAFPLLSAELGVSMWRFGRTLAEHLAACGSPPAALGLAGQVAFAAFPLLLPALASCAAPRGD